MAKIKCRHCKNGIVGYVQQEQSSAANPVYCSNCDGIGWLDEVAISKAETTSCEWCEIASACEYEVTFFKDDDRWATTISLMPNYCPNCGRKLKED